MSPVHDAFFASAWRAGFAQTPMALSLSRARRCSPVSTGAPTPQRQPPCRWCTRRGPLTPPERAAPIWSRGRATTARGPDARPHLKQPVPLYGPPEPQPAERPVSRARTFRTGQPHARMSPRVWFGVRRNRSVLSTERSTPDRFPMLGARRDCVDPDGALAGFRPPAGSPVVRGTRHGLRRGHSARPDAWVARRTRSLSLRQQREGAPLVPPRTCGRSRVDEVRGYHCTCSSSHDSRCPSNRRRASPPSGINIVSSVMSSPCGSRPPCVVGLRLKTPTSPHHDDGPLGTVSP